MSANRFPFAVRLIGFNQQETEIFDATFALDQGKGHGYFRLAEGNLQDPDVYIANAEELNAMVALSDLRPNDVRPVLLVGTPTIPLPYMRVDRPIRWQRLFEALDKLIEKRADTLARLEASDIVMVPERRRRNRVDFEWTDATDYQSLRSELPEGGAVLIVDKSPAFRDVVANVLARHQIEVLWAKDEAEAEAACVQQKVSVVLINTSIIDVDQFRLCHTVKTARPQDKTSVIFLVRKSRDYDLNASRQVNADGFLTKPILSRHVVGALKKFMHIPR